MRRIDRSCSNCQFIAKSVRRAGCGRPGSCFAIRDSRFKLLRDSRFKLLFGGWTELSDAIGAFLEKRP